MELLAACEALRDEFTRRANLDDLCWNDWPISYAVDDAIAKAKARAAAAPDLLAVLEKAVSVHEEEAAMGSSHSFFLPPQMLAAARAAIAKAKAGAAAASPAGGILAAAAPELLAACEYGGIGYDSIVLLHNVGDILAEFAKGHPNEENLRYMADALRHKGKLEFAAIYAARPIIKPPPPLK